MRIQDTIGKAACLLPFVCAAFIGCNDSGRTTPLCVDRASLQIGEVYFQPLLQHKITITNTGSSSVAIERFATSCECAKVVPNFLSIPAYSEAEVEIEIRHDISRLESMDRHRRLPFSYKIMPVSPQGTPLSTGWTIHGTERFWVSLPRTSVSFGEIPLLLDDVTSRSSFAITMPLEVDAQVATLKATSESAYIETRLIESGRMSISGRQVDLWCYPRITNEVGAFTTWVNIAATMNDGRELPAIRLPVFAEVIGSVSASPSIIFIDDLSGQPTSVVLTAGDSHFSVVDVSSDAPEVLCIERSKKTPDTCQYLISARKRLVQSQVTFIVEVADRRHTKEAVRITVVGSASATVTQSPQRVK